MESVLQAQGTGAHCSALACGQNFKLSQKHSAGWLWLTVLVFRYGPGESGRNCIEVHDFKLKIDVKIGTVPFHSSYILLYELKGIRISLDENNT